MCDRHCIQSVENYLFHLVLLVSVPTHSAFSCSTVFLGWQLFCHNCHFGKVNIHLSIVLVLRTVVYFNHLTAGIPNSIVHIGYCCWLWRGWKYSTRYVVLLVFVLTCSRRSPEMLQMCFCSGLATNICDVGPSRGQASSVKYTVFVNLSFSIERFSMLANVCL